MINLTVFLQLLYTSVLFCPRFLIYNIHDSSNVYEEYVFNSVFVRSCIRRKSGNTGMCCVLSTTDERARPRRATYYSSIPRILRRSPNTYSPRI